MSGPRLFLSYYASIFSMCLPPHVPRWLLEVQPSCLHSGQQGGGRNKEGHLFLLRTFPGSCTYHCCLYPVSYNLATWLHLAVREVGKPIFMQSGRVASLKLWDSVTEEERVLEMISALYHPFFQLTNQPLN